MAVRFFIVVFAGVLISGCHQDKKTQLQQPVSRSRSNFFPVTQYILGQLNDLDSLPVTPLKITTNGAKIDSTWLKKKDIRSFAQPFITPVIDSVHWHNMFSEKSFLDLTINAFTFTYDPIAPLPDSIELRRWDIYVDPGNNRVKRIFIVKQLNRNASPQTIQLTWKADHFCKITTITERTGGAPQIKEEQLIWNFNE